LPSYVKAWLDELHHVTEPCDVQDVVCVPETETANSTTRVVACRAPAGAVRATSEAAAATAAANRGIGRD